MIEAYKKFWKGYVDFEGRSTRSDYWFVVLANFLLIMALYIAAIIFAVAGRNQPGSLPNIIAYIFLIYHLLQFKYVVCEMQAIIGLISSYTLVWE